MTHTRLRLHFAASLMLLIGLALGTGAWQLLRAADAWPELTATAPVTTRTAVAMLILSLGFLISAVGIFKQRPGNTRLALIILGVFAIGGFIGNYVLFGSVRWSHSGTNLVIVAVTATLLTTANKGTGN